MAKILIGVSGSVAAFKTLTLIRELASSHEVKVILTAEAEKFLPPTLIAAFGIAVYTDKLDYNDSQQAMAHIYLAKFADLMIIAPASANTIAKCANGIADNLLTQTILAFDGKYPILLAPAMNQAMWKNHATQINIDKLHSLGYKLVLPTKGLQACGDNGDGCMQDPIEIKNIANQILNISNNGKHIIISLGATVEALDPVRYISNHSSGKMGTALINSALNAGFKVTAICGKTDRQLQNQHNLTIINALSANEMLNTIKSIAYDANIFISCAAICDYRAQKVAPQKIKKQSDSDVISFQLVKNPDVIATIAKQFPLLYCVGFAAETENILEHARDKLQRKSLKMIIANDVSNNQVFAKDTTSATIITEDGNILHDIKNANKEVAANIIIQYILKEYQHANS